MEFSQIKDRLDFPESDFAILSMETSHRPELARKVLMEIGISWPVLDDDAEIASKLFGVSGVPTNIFIDREGRMVFRSQGFSPGDEDEIVEMIEALIELPPESE